MDRNELNTEESGGCLSRLIKVFSIFNIRNQVYPNEPIAPKYSEFLKINNYTKLRLLHLQPENINIPLKYESVKEKRRSSSTNRYSLSEEYWFTRWNKPLQLRNTCNCSFRRSQRFSKLSEQFPSIRHSIRTSSVNRISNYDVPPTKIINVETFVERLIQETLFEALQEYYMKKDSKPKINNESNHQNGFDNFGFVKSLDDVDSVTLRRPKIHKDPAFLQVKYTNKESVQIKNCSHKKNQSQNKPLIILLHGIGSTADIWWNIIKCLLNKGFEVVAPDMLGHGYSSAPNSRKAYTFKKLLNNILAVFDYFASKDENRKFIIIGHSFGCSLATALSRYRSQQIVQLVLISGGGPTALSAPATNNEISVFSCLQWFISPLLFCGLKRSFFYSTRGKHFKPCVEDTSIPKYVLENIDKGQNWPEGDAAFHRRILIPTLLVHGLKDTQITLVQQCEMERTIPRAFLELIPNAGHMSLLDTPEHLSHMILCFVDWWTR